MEHCAPPVLADGGSANPQSAGDPQTRAGARPVTDVAFRLWPYKASTLHNRHWRSRLCIQYRFGHVPPPWRLQAGQCRGGTRGDGKRWAPVIRSVPRPDQIRFWQRVVQASVAWHLWPSAVPLLTIYTLRSMFKSLYRALRPETGIVKTCPGSKTEVQRPEARGGAAEQHLESCRGQLCLANVKGGIQVLLGLLGVSPLSAVVQNLFFLFLWLCARDL